MRLFLQRGSVCTSLTMSPPVSPSTIQTRDIGGIGRRSQREREKAKLYRLLLDHKGESELVGAKRV